MSFPCKNQQQEYRKCLERYQYRPGTKCSSIHQEYKNCLNEQFDRNDSQLESNIQVILPPEPCRPLACDIQDCLEKNNFQSSICRPLIVKFNACVKQNSKDIEETESEP